MPSKLKEIFPEFNKSDSKYLDIYHNYSLSSFVDVMHLDELLMVEKDSLLQKDSSGFYASLDTILTGFKNNYLAPNMVVHLTFNLNSLTFLDNALNNFARTYASLTTKDSDALDFFDYKKYLADKIKKHEIRAIEISDTGTVYLIDNRNNTYLNKKYVNNLYVDRFKKDYSNFDNKEILKISQKIKSEISSVRPALKHDNLVLLKQNDNKDIAYRNRLQMLVSVN